jgi:hypothetical protein
MPIDKQILEAERVNLLDDCVPTDMALCLLMCLLACPREQREFGLSVEMIGPAEKYHW